MAVAEPVKTIKDEVTCSICLDLFRDPVTTECEHSFCKECIAQHCKREDADTACPQCRKMIHKKNLRQNRELKNIVELINQSPGLQRDEEPGRISKCEKHQEALKLFCKNDQAPICVICRESLAHRTHTVVPMEEAVLEYRETIKEHLEATESTYEKLLLLVNKDWKHLPQSAREEEHKRLKRLTDKVTILLKVDIERHRQRFEDKACQTQPCASVLKSSPPGRKIAVETELQKHKERENIRERVSEKQETESHAIHFCEESSSPKYGLDHASLDPAVYTIRNTIQDAVHKVNVKSSGKSFQDQRSVRASLQFGWKEKDSVSPGGNVTLQTELQEREVDVTLDPATAHPRLILSEDRKNVRRGDTWQDLPNNPERFHSSVSVLGSEGFTSGRHYWEVEVGPGGDWAIGVTRDSVQRKVKIPLKPYFGVWALVSFEIPQKPRKIRVYLNYESGEVRFYNAENMALISSLTATFTGKVVPFFRLWAVGSHIKLSPCQR